MFWNKLMNLLLGGSLVMAQSVPVNLTRPVPIDEILSYDCALSITSLFDADDQLGPLFSRDDLVFTSIVTTSATPILVLSAGAGTFSVPLLGSGVNRLHIEIPSATSRAQSYYISYLHGASYRSRVFEFSTRRPPVGHEGIEYRDVVPARADQLQAHFEYAIFETAENAATALVNGSLERRQIHLVSGEKCNYISRRSPSVESGIRHNLALLDMIVTGPVRQAKSAVAVKAAPRVSSGRMPASLPRSVR
jgi:hypothetical protein